MKIISFLFLLALICTSAPGKERIYIGTTPAPHIVRDFLGISLTDSIDFIKWKLVIRFDSYELQCKYGISRPGTPGFENEKRVGFSGKLRKEKDHYYLKHEGRTLSILEINSNLFHLLDENKNLLVGNGGYSYTLNNKLPAKKD